MTAAVETTTLLDIEDLAARWGVTAQSLYNQRANGIGPKAFKVGRRLKFRLADVLEWEDEHAQAPGR